MTPDLLVYCERLQPGIWAEPANLYSNAGFLLAGAWVLNRYRRLGLSVRQLDLWVLALLILVIGTGSALWHSFHTSWARTLDVMPILIFIHLYLFSFLYRRLALHAATAVVVTAVYFAASKTFAGAVNPHLLHGTIFYVPALAALAMLTGWSYARQTSSRRLMVAAMLLFMSSLVFRTVDGPLCAYLPVGTHFLWHLLNALVLAMLAAAVSDGIAAGRSGSRQSAASTPSESVYDVFRSGFR